MKKVIIELRPSKIDKGGVGVFAITNIRKGQKVADGIHEGDYKHIIPWTNFKRYPVAIRKKIMSFCIGTPNGFIPPDDIDFNSLKVEWYFNHSCDGNLGFNKNGDFIALRNIKKDEEISYDYGLAESNPLFIMSCKCKSKNCRNSITGNDWKKYFFRKKWLHYMLPGLRK